MGARWSGRATSAYLHASIPSVVALGTNPCVGESIPITKSPLPYSADNDHHPLDTEANKNHVLFCGTEIVQARSATAYAVVVGTGFQTAKGELVRSILYPKPNKSVALPVSTSPLLHLLPQTFALYLLPDS